MQNLLICLVVVLVICMLFFSVGAWMGGGWWVAGVVRGWAGGWGGAWGDRGRGLVEEQNGNSLQLHGAREMRQPRTDFEDPAP